MRLSYRIGKIAVAGLVVLSLFATSCRYVREDKLPDSGATLEGTVKFGDQPIQFALIQIQTADGQAAGKIGDDGRYRVENVPLGEVLIGVNTSAAQGDFQSKMMSAGAYQGPDAKAKGKVTGLRFIQIPDKYFNPETSGLKTNISKGSNTYDIVIPR